MQELHDDNRLQYNERGIPRFKKYIDEMDGIPVTDWFDDINNVQKGEKLDYATQKPKELINRLVGMFSNPENVCLDIFAGSGTLGRSCVKMNRKFIMFDIIPEAKEIFDRSMA